MKHSTEVAAEPAVATAIASPAHSSRGLMVGYAFAALGAVLFSTKAIIIKLAYADGINAETLLALRMLLSLPFYAAIGLISVADRRRIGRPHMLFYGILLAIGATVLPSFLLNAALQRISAQANATIGTLSPVVTILLAVAILGEHFR